MRLISKLIEPYRVLVYWDGDEEPWEALFDGYKDRERLLSARTKQDIYTILLELDKETPAFHTICYVDVEIYDKVLTEIWSSK